MTEQEQIQEMAKIAEIELMIHFGDGDIVDPEDRPIQAESIAEAFYDAGYGDIKQAVKEFAEKLKEKFIRLEKRYGDEADRDENAIPNLQFEFYKPALERDGAFANGQATMANKALYIIDDLVKEVCGD